MKSSGVSGFLAYLLLVAVFAAAAAAGAWPTTGKPNCSLPALTIGPRLNSSRDLTRFVKRHKHSLIGFSAASCANCCLFEPIYNETLPRLPASVHWARVDLDRLEAKALAATHDLEVLPAVVFFMERRSYKLMEAQRPASLAEFVERALAPLPILQGSSNADKAKIAPGTAMAAWLEPRHAFGEVLQRDNSGKRLQSQHFVRVIVFLDDGAEEEDLEELGEAARSFAGRPLSFRFARLAPSKELAEQPLLQAACGSLRSKGRALVAVSLFDGEFVELARVQETGATTGEFEGVEMAVPKGRIESLIFNASLAGERADVGVKVAVQPRVSCRPLDSYDGLSTMQWVLRSALPAVGRFDTFTSALYETTQKPFLMLFADTKSPKLASWLKLLHAAHSHYNRAEEAHKDGLKMMFVYIDGLQYSTRMPSLGLAADPARLPALSFNFVNEKYVTWQPPAKAYANGTAKLTAEVVDSLIQRYLRGEGHQLVEKKAPKSLPVPKRDVDRGEGRVVPDLASLSLQERLRFVSAVTHDSFAELVMDTAKDVAVFFFASKGSRAEASKSIAIYMNRCAERFEELGISTVRIARLDMARFTPPAAVQISEVPSLVLFPAFSKDPPHEVYRGKFKVQHIMWWIQERASRPIKLPELPHLDGLEAKAYWEQKAELSEDRQKAVALENEGSAQRRSGRARPAGKQRGSNANSGRKRTEQEL